MMTERTPSNDVPPGASVTDRVQRLLRERFDLREDQVAADQPLEELGIDSLASIEFLFNLEEEFGVLFSDERSPIRTVRDLALLVERELGLKATAA